MDRWPQWLDNTVEICLKSGFPIALFIGRDLIHIHNDRYAEIIGNKHPDALGRAWAEVYPELSDDFRPMLEAVLSGNGPVWHEDRRIILRRGANAEEYYFTFSFSAIPDDAGGIGGVFCVCTETTGRVLGEQRMRTLYDLASACMTATSNADIGRAVERALARNPEDFPFAVLYRLEDGAPLSPPIAMIGLDRDDLSLWRPANEPVLSSGWRRLHGLAERLKALGRPPGAASDVEVDEAVALMLPGGAGREGVMLVVGRNPVRPFNMEYLSFLRLALGQIAGEMGSVRAYEGQRRQLESLAALERERARHSATLQTVLDSLSGAISCFDRDWNWTFVNDQALAYYKRPREEVIGRNLWEDWPILKETPLFPAAMRALKEGGPVRIEWYCPIAQTWLESRILAGPAMISLSSLDIADRRKAEQGTRKRVREQEAVARFGHGALLGLGPETLMREVVDVVADALEVPRAAVIELERERNGRLLVRAERGFSPELPGLRLKHGRSLAGYTLSLRRPVIAPDLSRETRFDGSILRRLGVVSALSVIIEGPDRTPYGVLQAHTTEPHDFQRSAVAFMESMANVLGAAIQRWHAEHALARERARLEVRERERTQNLRKANARLQALSRRLIDVQEAERRHIARELHDEIGQNLTLLKMNLLGLKRRIQDQEAAARLHEDVDRLDELLGQIRNLSLDLGPSSLEDLGLVAALRSHAHLVAARTGLRMSFRVVGEERRLPGELETAGFRIGQEAITNVIRHAAAMHLHVEVRFGGRSLTVVVRDDGVGFDAAGVLDATERAATAGLLGMQERAMLVGGTLKVVSQPGAGTTIRARLPMVGAAQKRRRGFAHGGKIDGRDSRSFGGRSRPDEGRRPGALE